MLEEHPTAWLTAQDPRDAVFDDLPRPGEDQAVRQAVHKHLCTRMGGAHTYIHTSGLELTFTAPAEGPLSVRFQHGGTDHELPADEINQYMVRHFAHHGLGLDITKLLARTLAA